MMSDSIVCGQVRLAECQLRICRDDWNSTAHHISVAARQDALLNTDQLLALDIRAAARTPARHWRGYVVPVTEVRVVLCSDPSVPKPVVQSRRRPLLGPSPS